MAALNIDLIFKYASKSLGKDSGSCLTYIIVLFG